MKEQELFLQLLSDTEPRKKALAGSFEYGRYGFTYDDIRGFMDEKLLHVFMKYPDTPYEEVKAIALASIHRVIPAIIRKYGREVLTEEKILERAITDVPLQMGTLIENVLPLVQPSQRGLVEIILDPPVYVLARVNRVDKRVPSRLLLEFLGATPSPYNIKMLNKFRKKLFKFIRSQFDPTTLELKQNLSGVNL